MSEDDKKLVKRDEYSPFGFISEFDKIFDDFRRGFDSLLFEPRLMPLTTIRAPVMDIIDQDDKFVITAEVPGIPKEKIDIHIVKNKLEIKAEDKVEKEEKKEGYIRRERGQRSFYRQIILPEDVDAEKIDANLKNGILEVVIPKKEPEPKKKITVK
ncbi:MAG: Hsp20/alpha crystallin family protein [Candidatus Helarchaeota archaeon]